MPSFQTLTRATDREKTTRNGRLRRVDGLEVFPQSLQTVQMANEVLENIGSSAGVAFNWPSGGGIPLVITTTTEHIKKPDDIRVGTVPFQILLLQDSINNTLNNEIPYSALVPWGSYQIIGPLSETQTIARNSNGDVLWETGSKTKIIHKTYIYNISGLSHSIIYVTGARAFIPVGGQGG